MKKNAGFGLVYTIAAIVVIAAVMAVGLLVYANNNQEADNDRFVSNNTKKSKVADPYVGWESATSTRAKFSIKYPSDWQYSESVGDKDNIEHIKISSSKFQISIDSFNGKDPANGGTAETRCSDCLSTGSSESFIISKLGSINLDTVIYKIDNGQGNALILRLADGTYLIPSTSATNVYTRFRGISSFTSVQDYQNETTAQFAAHPDFKTAKKILKSLSY